MFKFRVSYKNKVTSQEDWIYIHVEDKAQLVPDFYERYPSSYFTLLDIQEVNGLNQSLMQPWKPTPGNDYSFGTAIAALKQGKKVARKGWNGKGMWLTLVPAWNYNPSDTNSPAGIEKLPWIGMKTADNKFVPWLASQTDMLAEDWEVIE